MSSIKLKHSGGNAVSLHPPTSAPSSSDVQFKLPSADGTDGQVITTNGSGQLAFATVAPPHYSFRARSSSGNWQSFGDTNFHIMPFNAEDFDIGSNYNTSTYKFTAPVSGIYYFYAQMFHDGSNTSNGNSGKIRIYVGNDIIAEGRSSGQGETVGPAVLWNVTAGAEVYAMGATGNTNADDWYGTTQHSYFTGYYIGAV